MTQDALFHIHTGERQLFLDEDDIDQVVGLQKIFHPAEKKGPGIRRIPAIGGYPEIRTAPAWDPDGGVWKIWTVCVTPEELQGQAGMSGYHESHDGLHWCAPNTGQVQYQGSAENNFVFIFASFFYHTGRAWEGRNHDGFHQVQLAVSQDMHHWARVGNRQAFIAPSPLGAGA